MKTIIVLVSFCLFGTMAIGQKEWSNWYKNGITMLTFKNGYAQVINNYIPASNNVFNFYTWGQGGISYSDPTSGNMKFIISNSLGFDRNYDTFPSQYFIKSCPDDNSYHIIPFHNNPDKFYVIQFQSASADILQQSSGLQVRCPNAIGLAYSIVDLSLNNGLGAIPTVNTTGSFTSKFTEQITTVRHANGADVWIILHTINSSEYWSVLVTDVGIQPPVKTSIGPFVNAIFNDVQGKFTASHNGKMLAGYSGTYLGGITQTQLFDFDNATGKLSNYRTLPYSDYTNKLQFSPDDSKLYSLGNAALYQYDLNQANVAATLTNVHYEKGSGMYDMQLAPDGKIYVSSIVDQANNSYQIYLGAVECPNLPQYACNFNRTALSINSSMGFPDLINDFITSPKQAPITKFNLGNDTAVCFGTYKIAAPLGWESYKWNTGDTTREIIVDSAATYYVLTGNTGFSCPSGYGYITVSDRAIKLNLGKDTTLCPNTPYTIHIPASYNNILWANGSNVRDSVITKSNQYIVSATDQNGCFTKDTIGVFFNSNLQAAFGNDTTLCNSTPLKLQLLPVKSVFTNAVYKWQDGSTNDTFWVRKAGKYWGMVSYQGCTVSDTIQVNFLSVANVYLGNDTTVCAGDSLRLTSSIGNAKYVWNTTDTTKSIYVKTTGDYWLKVNNGTCTVSDTIHVTFKAKPVFSLGSDTTLCNKDVLILNPSIANGNFIWQDNSTAKQYTVKMPGLYWLQVTQNGCLFTDSIKIDYKPLPPLNLGSDTGFCINTFLLLNSFDTSIKSYKWQDNSLLSSYKVLNAGTYSVTVVGKNGCINRDTIVVNAVPVPVFSLGNDTALCKGQTLNYNFNLPNATYLWSNGTSKPQFSISLPGIYSLKVTQQGCSNADTITIRYNPSPTVFIGNDTTLCANNTLQLNAANNNASYIWQDGSTTSNYLVSKAGLYFVKVTIGGCSVADSILITYLSSPLISLAKDTFLCNGQNVQLIPVANTTVSYRWQDGTTNPTFIAKDIGRYTVSVTNECGTAIASVIINKGLCELDMPTGFTPNRDGKNDLFRVKYPFTVKQFRMIIYDRWGGKMFETNDMGKGWDGTMNAYDLPQGVYLWFISLIDVDGISKSAKGAVLLIR